MSLAPQQASRIEPIRRNHKAQAEEHQGERGIGDGWQRKLLERGGNQEGHGMSKEKYEPTRYETEDEEMRRKALLIIRTDKLWLRILKLERQLTT